MAVPGESRGWSTSASVVGAVYLKDEEDWEHLKLHG